jgi:tocopherol O-methyltransferase
MATPAAIREHYDSLAFIYKTFWGDHIHHGLFVDGDGPARAQARLLEYCVGLLGALGRDVLDVGCGHGGTAVYLAEQHRCRVVGITISEKQAHIARENASRTGVAELVTIVAENAETFLYLPAHFDLVWTMESSEHFADKWGYFKNVARTLCAGGQLLLAAWTATTDSPRLREIAKRFVCPELWTPERYLKAIEAAGLRVCSCEDLSDRVARTWEICSERAKAAGCAVKLLPAAAREFVAGIDVIVEAYRSGELTYTVIAAEKP